MLLYPPRDVVCAPDLEHAQVPGGGVVGCKAEIVDVDIASSHRVLIPL